MAKRANKWQRPHRDISSMSVFPGTTTQEGPSWDFGRPYKVRIIAAPQAKKNYICPGCQGDIFPGHSHIVAWPEFNEKINDRRHWHTRCWENR